MLNSPDRPLHHVPTHSTHRRPTHCAGAFFYFTHDRRYIIKTATKEEFATLLRILPRYYAHVHSHPNTLINRIVGAHELALYGQRVSSHPHWPAGRYCSRTRHAFLQHGAHSSSHFALIPCFAVGFALFWQW